MTDHSKVDKWQPIETFPRDGRQFQVTDWESEDGNGYACIELVKVTRLLKSDTEIFDNLNSGNMTEIKNWTYWRDVPLTPGEEQ